MRDFAADRDHHCRMAERQAWTAITARWTELTLILGAPVPDGELVLLADAARGATLDVPPPYEINFVAEARGLADVIVASGQAGVLNPELTDRAADIVGDEMRRRTQRYQRDALVRFLDT